MTPVDTLLLLALAGIWGSSFLFIRIAVESFGPAWLVLARVLLGGLVLWLAARAFGRRIEVRAHVRPLLLLGLLNAALPYVLVSAAELAITASFAALLNATVPMFAAIFAALWLGERFTPARVSGLAAGVVGVAVMVGWSPIPLTRPVTLGVLAMLAASASYALAGVYARLRLRGVPTYSLALGQQLGAVPWLLLPAAAMVPSATPPGGALLAVGALGVLCTAVAYLLYFRLLDRVGPTRTATVTYLLPAFGVLWGAVFLGERVTPGMVAGFACVVASLVLVNGVRRPAAAVSPATSPPPEPARPQPHVRRRLDAAVPHVGDEMRDV